MGSRFTFVYVGRLAAEKRADMVLDAFRLASGMVPRGVIHLVSRAPDRARPSSSAAARRGSPFSVSSTAGAALPDLYANCDAFVFASVTETLGLVVLEAMASGLPVIAAPEGGVRDHLRDGRNGLTYGRETLPRWRAPWCRWSTSGSSRRRLARKARHTVERLSWEREMDRLDASYREVCASARHGLRRRETSR